MTNNIYTYSLIVPIYKNEENISELLDAVAVIAAPLEKFEAIFVVDGSPDQSSALLTTALPQHDFPSQLIALSRNFGSFAAIRHGLQYARGQYHAVLSADLQEPPELIQMFFAVLQENRADIVLGTRTTRDDGALSGICSGLFWTGYRLFVQPEIPKGGVDIFACNDQVRKNLLTLEENNTSLVGQLFWVGFRRHTVAYERRKRHTGKSGWNFRRKLKYMLDSIFAFTDLPIMLLLWLGALGVAGSLIISLAVIVSWWVGLIPVLGYTPIILSILFFGSLMLFGQGIIGCYVWRTNENTKRRPLAITATQTVFDPQGKNP